MDGERVLPMSRGVARDPDSSVWRATQNSGGVVKSLVGFGGGPVGIIRTQNFQSFQNKKPTSVVERYDDLWHKADITAV
jgi:hypothetical protein